MPPSPSASRTKLIVSPNNRKVTDFFKPVPARKDPHTSTHKTSDAELSGVSVSPPGQTSPRGTATAPKLSLNESFTSVSTLSSLPPSTSSSSRRVFKNGLLAVTNSDSDSDDSASSSEGLADVSTFIARKRRKITPPPLPTQDVKYLEAEPAFRKSSRISAHNRNQRQRCVEYHDIAPPRTYKHSLQRIAKQHAEYTARAAKVAAIVACVDEEEDLQTLQDGPIDASDSKLVAAAIAKEGDDGERVLHALERTEALEATEIYHLFAENPQNTFDPPFPIHDVPSGLLRTMLADENTRIRAFMSGFVTQMASKALFGTSMVTWLAAQLVREPRKDLTEAYMKVIEACIVHGKTFDQGLATLETFYTFDNPTSGSKAARRRTQTCRLCGFGHICRVVQLCASLAGKESLAQVFTEFALANMDDDVVKNPALRRAVQDALVQVANAVHDDEEEAVLDIIRRRLLDDGQFSLNMQCQIMRHLPATSPKAHQLRRRLSLFCITRDLAPQPLASPHWANSIVSRMTKMAEWVIGDVTDYTVLTSLAELADVAIDAGFSPSHYSWLSLPAAPNKTSFGRIQSSSSEEKAFNAQIDELTARFKAIKSHIKAGGATQMRRMEARSALERVEWRLAYGVRTKPKPQHDLFAGDLDETQHRLTDHFSRNQVVVTAKKDDGDESSDIS